MKKYFSACVASIISACFSCIFYSLNCYAQTQPAAQATHAVGMHMIAYQDASRQDWSGQHPRPLNGLIWYPAQAGSVEKAIDIAILKLGRFAVDAPLAESSEKYPLVVISHGTGGSAAAMAWLARDLAAQGFIVAAVNHHGNTAAEPEKRAEGFLAWWERPRDLSVLIDQLLADPVFGASIDAQRIGVAGFSLGGYSALASVGARLDFQQWLSQCQVDKESAQCSLPPEANFTRKQAVDLLTKPGPFQTILARSDLSYRDVRIRSAFVIAPVLVRYMQPGSFAEITVPVELVVGEQDDQAIPDQNAALIVPKLKGANLTLLSKVTHYTFLAECTDTGKRFVAQFCADPEGVNRVEVHQKIGNQAVVFFNRTLH